MNYFQTPYVIGVKDSLISLSYKHKHRKNDAASSFSGNSVLITDSLKTLSASTVPLSRSNMKGNLP
jgi:hypothetical protein